VNSELITRTLLVRLLMLIAGIGLAISTLPGIVALSTVASSSKLAYKEQLSIQLNAW